MASLTSPATPTGKAGAASPKMTDEDATALEETEGDEKKLRLHEDIMQLARLGEIGPIKTLFDEGKYDPKYKDDEDITPLHVGSRTNLFCSIDSR